jgi:hypothetical protein
VDLDAVAEELYGLVPSEFTARRTERVAEARRAGDRDLADSVGKLRKPTVGAWAVNQLARRRAKELSDFLDLGPRLRRAQETLSGDDIRRLSHQRQDAVGELREVARSLAQEAGLRLNDAARTEVEHVLEQALGDPRLAAAVRAGRLSTAVTAPAGSGFGLGGPPGSAGLGTRTGPRPAGGADEGRGSERALAEARRRAQAARRATERAEKALERIRARLAHAEETLHELRAEEGAATDELREARKAERTAQQDEARADAAVRRPRR